MIKLKLIKPTIEYKQQVLETVQEFEDNNSNLYGVSGLKRFLDNYEGRLDSLKKREHKETITDKSHVPQKQFLLIQESNNKLIGFISMRLELNDLLLVSGGHISYAIRPTERKKNYASAQLFSILDIYENIGIEKVLLICDKTNIGSAKTIQKCGGILENEVIDPDDGQLVQRYWIDVKEGIEKGKSFFEDTGICIENIL